MKPTVKPAMAVIAACLGIILALLATGPAQAADNPYQRGPDPTRDSVASFEGTGAWTPWVTKTLTVTLNVGSNTIRLNLTTADGLPNIDYFEIPTS